MRVFVRHVAANLIVRILMTQSQFQWTAAALNLLKKRSESANFHRPKGASSGRRQGGGGGVARIKYRQTIIYCILQFCSFFIRIKN